MSVSYEARKKVRKQVRRLSKLVLDGPESPEDTRFSTKTQRKHLAARLRDRLQSFPATDRSAPISNYVGDVLKMHDSVLAEEKELAAKCATPPTEAEVKQAQDIAASLLMPSVTWYDKAREQPLHLGATYANRNTSG